MHHANGIQVNEQHTDACVLALHIYPTGPNPSNTSQYICIENAPDCGTAVGKPCCRFSGAAAGSVDCSKAPGLTCSFWTDNYDPSVGEVCVPQPTESKSSSANGSG